MCGRYLYLTEEDELRELLYLASFGTGFDPDSDFSGGEIFPSARVPVVTGWYGDSADYTKAEIKAEISRWGLPRRDYSLSGTGLIINSRRENVMRSPVFSKLLDSGRCAVPASGYFEWGIVDTGEDKPAVQMNLFGETGILPKYQKKQKYFFSNPDDTVLYMAGLIRRNKDESKFSIITGDANNSAVSVHNRMPLILTRKMLLNWLSPGTGYLDVLHCAIPDVSCMAAGE
jgi:putative SOS response-associated peptidase YedK